MRHPAVIGLVNADGTAWVQIPGATVGLRVTVGNLSGTGTLTATNTAWSCTGSGTAQLACTVKSEGRLKLRQGGLTSAQPLVVRFPALLGAAVVIPVG
ncbi:hypothetical protein N864_19960 [Intrasporangium chromatireducens Q5-1]|uniref:Uncharacterized protein n=1 Tax=Intrasporangium chromatireducens Q5-1 TaxID=584657 RepID=W9GE64_9MICO|nr:hypothetical protein N864_19960 [Intrasporangium chromatireducens Q5-1]